MKTLRNALTALLTALLIMGALPFTALAADNTAGAPLQFKNGKFKILILSDIQDTNTPQQATVDLMNNAIDQTKPDFIALTGDNIAGWWKGVTPEETKAAVDIVGKAINDRKIPFALVFGNHDHEGLCDEQNGMTEEQAKKQLMAWFQAYEYCMAVDGEEMTGVGNYNLPILNTAGNKTVFNLWFMDSNPYTDESEGGGYGYVHKDQIDWYERTSNALKAENGGKPVPSLLFQHIVVPEVYNMFTEVSKGTKGAVRGNANHTSQYYVTNPDYIDAGHLNEGPCPANTANDGQLDSWVKQGDILGAIFGHDHVNDYAGTYKGIRLLAAPAVTFYSYGNYRGVRTIDLDESNLSTFQTQVIPADKLMDYTVKNPYIREHGYYEYKSVFIPALCGGIAGLAALTAVIIVLVKVIKKHKAKKQNQ